VKKFDWKGRVYHTECYKRILKEEEFQYAKEKVLKLIAEQKELKELKRFY